MKCFVTEHSLVLLVAHDCMLLGLEFRERRARHKMCRADLCAQAFQVRVKQNRQLAESFAHERRTSTCRATSWST